MSISTRLEALEQRLRPALAELPAQVLHDLGRIYGDGTPAPAVTWAEVDAAIARIYGEGDPHVDGEAAARD